MRTVHPFVGFSRGILDRVYPESWLGRVYDSVNSVPGLKPKNHDVMFVSTTLKRCPRINAGAPTLLHPTLLHPHCCYPRWRFQNPC